jgi:hypothetical protein
MNKIDDAIEVLAGKIVQSIQHDAALKFSQSILNLAHANVLMERSPGAVEYQVKGPEEKVVKGPEEKVVKRTKMKGANA